MFDWLQRAARRLSTGPGPKAPSFSPRGFHQLNSGFIEVLGNYQAGEPPVIFSPIQTRNRWSRSTLLHEQTHQQLTLNTAYGALWQLLDRADQQGALGRLHEMCSAAQWGVQEAVATYAQMSYVAVDDPDGLDAAISFLPSADLGQPPYREWFDRVQSLVPLQPVHDEALRSQTSDQADFVLALGVYALNSNVLVALPRPTDFDEESFRLFLERNGPDVRLVRMIEWLQDSESLSKMLVGFRMRRDAERARGESVQRSLDWLTQNISSRDPCDTFLDNSSRIAQTEAFFQSWAPATSVVVSPRGQEPIATLPYTKDWIERFPDAFPEDTLTLGAFRAQLSLANGRKVGLACSIGMFHADELHLTTMLYPPGENINPASWEAVLSFLEDRTRELASAGVFTSASILDVLEQFPLAPLWVDFIRESWRAWDSVAAHRHVLRDTVQTCTEVELSLDGVQELLEFRGIYQDPQYSVFLVHGQQYAACLFNPHRPRVYALQGVQGEAGLAIFAQIAERLQVQRFPGKFVDLPHATLLRLAGQGLLL